MGENYVMGEIGVITDVVARNVALIPVDVSQVGAARPTGELPVFGLPRPSDEVR